jgi:hypothetical protein
MKIHLYFFISVFSLTMSCCESPNKTKRVPEENPNELVDPSTSKRADNGSQTADQDLSDEEIAQWFYDRILIPSFNKQDEPLILVLESLRTYYFSDLGGRKSHTPLVFVYRFDPEYSFRKISVSINVDRGDDGTIGELMNQIGEQLPIKLRLEGSMWVFEDAANRSVWKSSLIFSL